MLLRVTRRALADMDLDDVALAGKPAEEIADEHRLIAAFVNQRSQRAEGQEAIQLPRSKTTVLASPLVTQWDRTMTPITVEAPNAPPALTPRAARALLRLLMSLRSSENATHGPSQQHHHPAA